ncbi:MAG TPA: carboxymuconolactone decarboxylase family protein [Chthoniobacteraceae bacterium]|nr:carboxymuconolactone decarboxylase family protein [Chthoniobacteraceae bacterium]
MKPRLNYYPLAPASVKQLAAVNKTFETFSIPAALRALIELRVSQLNGCAYCVDMHSRQARRLGELQRRLDALPVWRESPFFDERERALLAWTEALTFVAETHAPDDLYEALSEHFSGQEIVEVSLIISVMNAWNRMGIGFRKLPEDVKSHA